MHSFQNFIVRLIPNHPPPLETRIWKLVVRALSVASVTLHTLGVTEFNDGNSCMSVSKVVLAVFGLISLLEKQSIGGEFFLFRLLGFIFLRVLILSL